MKWGYITSMEWEMVYTTRICMNMEKNMMWDIDNMYKLKKAKNNAKKNDNMCWHMYNKE